MTAAEPSAQASWFDDAVDAYDRARTSYPEALFDRLDAYMGRAGHDSPSEAVEIGPGTGKATASLLARGMRVTGVEPGPNLAAFLRRKFADEPAFRVINAKFEEAPLAHAAYDLVTSATAFAWVEPTVRLVKSHRVVRRGGTLAVIDTNQIASAVDRGFFKRNSPIYAKYRQFRRPDPEGDLPSEDVVPKIYDELTASRLFESVELQRYRWDQTYPTALYADLMRSYSDIAMMAPEPREAMIADLCALIDAEFEGYVVRPLVFTLVTAKKK